MPFSNRVYLVLVCCKPVWSGNLPILCTIIWVIKGARLFWCLHSTHHASESMSLSVLQRSLFLGRTLCRYYPLLRFVFLMGVNPPLLFLIMFVDGTWGAFIHIGENLMKDARLGFL